MNYENNFARFMRNTGPARFFIPVGILMIIFGVILLGFHTENYLETVGKVTTVAEEVIENNQKEYDVSFTYQADGKSYEGTFDNLSERPNVGDEIKVFYDPEDPNRITNTKMGGFIAPLLILLGAAALIFGVLKTVKSFQKSKELDKTVPGRGAPQADFDGFQNAAGVTEYYCRFDGHNLKPGYIVEDANRRILYEGKMLKNNPIGPRVFEFTNHITGSVREHEVGHTTTQTYNDEFFSVSSWFKFDGKNVWDVLHERGLRMTTDLRSKFPNLTYDVSKNGQPLARIRTSSIYVHEEDEAQHKLVIPTGRYYYRFWTNSNDFDTLFLTIFAISETEQTIVE